MPPNSLYARLVKRIRLLTYSLLDPIYTTLDRTYIQRAPELKNIPTLRRRIGGKVSYAEWGYVIGLIQTIVHPYIRKGSNILEIGSGTGIGAIAFKHFEERIAAYRGLDIRHEDIEFCKRNYESQKFKFVWVNADNPRYTKGSTKDCVSYPIADDTFDLVFAMSVWTHLQENEFRHYLSEISRALKKDGTAIISVFLLDHPRSPSNKFRQWDFSEPLTEGFFTTPWAPEPEAAIAVTRQALEAALAKSNLHLRKVIPGTWRKASGLYFQDFLIITR